jgi:hypothetical protein
MAAARCLLLFALVCLAAPAIAAERLKPIAPPREAVPAPVPTPAEAASHADLARVCALVRCRTERREIRLIAQDGGAFGVENDLFPYVDDTGGVVIYAGEAFEVSLDRADPSKLAFGRLVPRVSADGLSGYRAPRPGDAPPTGPALLSFQLTQESGKPNMMLAVRNDTGVPLKFDATMYVPTREGLRTHKTSTCAIMPGTMGYEMWPHPVIMLVLSNFRRVKGGGATISCE